MIEMLIAMLICYLVIGLLIIQVIILHTLGIYSPYFIMDDFLLDPQTKPFGDELHIKDSIQVEHNSIPFTGKVYIIK